ncbi:MAG: hypothetical protein R2755_24040 [Acidimicrobiales bacterium]
MIAILGDQATDSIDRFQVVWVVAGIGFAIHLVTACATRCSAGPSHQAAEQ